MSRPVGIFDSGIGGISVLRALRDELPHQDLVYVADSGHAPYGERDPAHATQRSLAVARYLVTQHHIQTLVVACNTATAAAIHLLREQYAGLPIVGVEPALKPAASASRTGHIGVLATRSTLRSTKFQHLLHSLDGQARFSQVACDGLADSIERQDDARIDELAARYVGSLGQLGTVDGAVDTIVLGCTHYPLIADRLQALAGTDVRLIDSGQPVARQVHRVLPDACHEGAARLSWYTTGRPGELAQVVTRWVQAHAQVHPLTV